MTGKIMILFKMEHNTVHSSFKNHDRKIHFLKVAMFVMYENIKTDYECNFNMSLKYSSFYTWIETCL